MGVLFCFFLGTPYGVVGWSRLRRVTFQRWKVTKDRRACGPGPGVGGRRNRYGACKPFGCYPPFQPPPSILRPLAPRADIPLAKLESSCPAFGCTHAAQRWYQPLQDSFGVESVGVVFMPLVLSEFSELSVRSMLSLCSVLQNNGTICEKHMATGFFRTDSTPSPSCRRWQSERRHVDQPRQRNYYQVLQGGYPPEGPMAEV